VAVLEGALKLTAEQKQRIAQIQSRLQGPPPAPANGGPPDFAAIRQQMQQKEEAAAKEIEALLTPEQKQALPRVLEDVQILVRVGLPAGLLNTLELTAEQKSKLADIGTKARQAMQQMLEQARQSGARPDVAALQQARAQTQQQVQAVLTPAQMAQVDKYRRDNPQRGPGGGPGGPGRAGGAYSPAKLDQPVPNITLRDVMSQKPISLGEYKGKKPIVAVFMSDTCGTTWRYEKRLGEFLKKYGKDVVLLGVHSNANGTDEGIRRYAEARNFGAPVLDDKKNNELAAWVDARNTPTVLVIDTQGVLRYQGSWDDNEDEAGVKQRFAENAVEALLAGKPVAVKANRPFG
jgi:Spy/CpxP family protein refolding chaperone/peroxiredoxin